MAEDLNAYARPSATALYSEDFFKSLTFLQASRLNLPAIAPPHAVSGWSFSPEIPLSAPANLILPSETTIPAMISVQPILQGMQSAYIKGMRSVKITRPSEHGTTTNHYHFSKVCIVSSTLLKVLTQ